MKKVNIDSFVDDQSLIVINQNGHLRKIYCPFKVLCVEAVNNIPHQSWCYVESIQTKADTEIMYCILGRAYSYRNFHIYINF